MSGLISDPLFQLNLLLWMALPQPAESRINPILYAVGYQVQWICPRLPLGQDLMTKLVLKHTYSDEYLVITAAATRPTELLVLLSNSLPDLNKDASKDLWVSPNDFVKLKLIEKPDGVYINFGYSNLLPGYFGEVQLLEGGQYQDYRPLYLIPVDLHLSAPDQLSLLSLQERFRAAFLAHLAQALRHEPLVIDLEALWQRAVVVWDLWMDLTTKQYLIKQSKMWLIDWLYRWMQKLAIDYHVTEKAVTISKLGDWERALLFKEFQSNMIRKSQILHEQLSLDLG